MGNLQKYYRAIATDRSSGQEGNTYVFAVRQRIESSVIIKLVYSTEESSSARSLVWHRDDHALYSQRVCVVTGAALVYLFGTKQTRTFIRSIGKQSIIRAHLRLTFVEVRCVSRISDKIMAPGVAGLTIEKLIDRFCFPAPSLSLSISLPFSLVQRHKSDESEGNSSKRIFNPTPLERPRQKFICP